MRVSLASFLDFTFKRRQQGNCGRGKTRFEVDALQLQLKSATKILAGQQWREQLSLIRNRPQSPAPWRTYRFLIFQTSGFVKYLYADCDLNRKPQETVTITVGRGADSQTFKIHKDTLCYYSSFFTNCIQRLVPRRQNSSYGTG
jgi:hypothetical protein